jgi:2-polyprenyl-3-methyl-5-hydroxy-6-metoxy-1,4-benzoquinol methylase
MAETDIAHKDYWNRVWAQDFSSSEIRLGPWDYENRIWDGFLRRLIGESFRGARALEIGCAPGRWMIYFNKRMGLKVAGIEYTKSGVELTKRNLAQHKVIGDVYEGDFLKFEFPVKFDIIASFGVVEHYLDLHSFFNKCWNLLTHDGLCITAIPNFGSHFYASLQSSVDRDVWKRHIPYRASDLTKALGQSGFNQVDWTFLGTFSIGVVNFSKYVTPNFRFLGTFLAFSDGLLHFMFKARYRNRESAMWSPYIFTWASKNLNRVGLHPLD